MNTPAIESANPETPAEDNMVGSENNTIPNIQMLVIKHANALNVMNGIYFLNNSVVPINSMTTAINATSVMGDSPTIAK